MVVNTCIKKEEQEKEGAQINNFTPKELEEKQQIKLRTEINTLKQASEDLTTTLNQKFNNCTCKIVSNEKISTMEHILQEVFCLPKVN